MNPEQINRLISEKVMGWHRDEFSAYYWDNDEYATIGIAEFDPYHRIEHAHMALEKFEEWDIYKRDKQFMVRIVREDRMTFYSPWVATLSAAICEAIVAAVEGKE